MLTKIGATNQLRTGVQQHLNELSKQLDVNISIGDVDRFGMIIFSIMFIFFFNLQDGCPPAKTTIPSHSGRQDLTITIYWPESNIGEQAIVNCPCGNSEEEGEGLLQASRYCRGDFTSRAKWSEENVAACNFSDLAREICRLKSVY